MKSNRNLLWVVPIVCLSGCLGGGTDAKSSAPAPAAPEGAFSSLTIDLGVVVSDVDKSVAFYRDVVGFREVKGFSVPPVMGRDAGLTDSKPLDIRVMILGEGPGATKLKLMAIKGAKSAKTDQAFIHSSLGYSYITIRIKDTAAAMARLKKHGIKPLAKGPYELPKGFPKGIFLTVVRDPDGNPVELVGPKL